MTVPAGSMEWLRGSSPKKGIFCPTIKKKIDDYYKDLGQPEHISAPALLLGDAALTVQLRQHISPETPLHGRGPGPGRQWRLSLLESDVRVLAHRS